MTKTLNLYSSVNIVICFTESVWQIDTFKGNMFIFF